MKKLITIAFSVILIGTLITSCRPDNDFSIGQPQNRISQLAGTWKLQTVTQIDLDAKNKNFVDPSRPDVNLIQQDITNIAPFTDMAITFANDAGVPSSFTINYGAAPKIFKVSGGNWKVDNLETPGKIQLINGTDTMKTNLGNVNNLSSGLLTLQLIKFQGIKPVIEYDYNFKKN